MKIDRHISDLLYCYDCVIIPEFGGFVANYVPAKIDKTKHVFHPPSKGILFNKNLTHNDGLLAHQIAREEQRTFEDANLLIRDYVQDCRLILDEGRRVEIKKVGILYYDHERNIQFEAQKELNYLQDSFGLTSFYVPPVQKTELEQKPVKVEPVVKQEPITTVVDEPKIVPITPPKPEPKPEPVTEKKLERKEETVKENRESVKPEPVTGDDDGGKKKRWGWYVAAAVLIPILFYSVWIPTQTDALETGHIHSSDFNPFHKDSAPAYEPATELEPFVIEINPNEVEELFEGTTEDFITLDFTPDGSLAPIVVLIRKPEIAEPDNTYVEPDNVGADNYPVDTGLMYHVIGGCFQYLDNATGLVAELKKKGFDAYIVDQNKGLHRVCFGSYATRDEAKLALQDIQATENSSAWILKKAVQR